MTSTKITLRKTLGTTKIIVCVCVCGYEIKPSKDLLVVVQKFLLQV